MQDNDWVAISDMKPLNKYTIVCSRPVRKKCAYCPEVGTQICDRLVGGTNADGSKKTCDKPVCKRHALRSGGFDYCVDHTQDYPSSASDAARSPKRLS